MYTKYYPVLFGTIYIYVQTKTKTPSHNKSIQSKWIYLRR